MTIQLSPLTEVDFTLTDDTIEVNKVWYRGKRVRLTPWREWVLAGVLQSRPELQREYDEAEWARKYEYNL